MADRIDAYVAALRRELSFDRALADRLAQEVEDHLREAAEADASAPPDEAQRRAIARFGSGREITTQLASASADRKVKQTWITLLIAVIATLVAMRLRVIWIDDGAALGAALGLAPLIDRYAFLAAVAVAGIGWLVDRRRFLPLAICLAGLIASIAAGFVRADLFAGGAPVPVLLAAGGEVALVALLSLHLVGLGRHLSRTAALRRLGS